MKRFAAVLLLMAMLCTVSCKDNASVPAETTENATTAAVTAEPLDITFLLDGYTVHELSSDELESFRDSFPSDSALGKIAVKVTDYGELYLLIEDAGEYNKDPYHPRRASIHRVICGNSVQDCNIPFATGPVEYDLIKTDEYAVVGNRETDGSFYYIFSESGCTQMPVGSGRDGSSPVLYEEDGVLKYRTVNPKYVWVQTPLSMLDVVESEDDWKTEWGTVSVANGEVILTKTDEESVKEDYDLRKLFDEMKAGTSAEYTMPEELHWVTDLDRLMEYNKAKAKFTGINVDSDEGIMYRLMAMTCDEIYETFSKTHEIQGGGSDRGDLSWHLQWNEDTNFQITFMVRDNYVDDPEWNWNEACGTAKPSYVVAHGDSFSVYPGIKSSMTTAEVAEIIPEWDGVRMWSDSEIITFLELGGLTYSVTWDLDDETRNVFKAASLENNSVDQEKLRYDFAQKFLNNIVDYSATVNTVTIQTAKYAEYTPPEEPEYTPTDDELAQCTVYDVTTDKDSYFGPCDEWMWKETEEMPQKIALRFSDVDGLTIIMDIAEGVFFNKSIYYVTRIFNDDVDIVIPHGDGFRYIPYSVYVKRIGDITVVADIDRPGERFYVINGDKYDIIRNNMFYTNIVYDLIETEEGFSYISYSRDYHGTLIRPSSTVMDYKVGKHFCEYGKLVFEDGEAEFVKDGDMTFDEWYLSDLFKWKEQREKYGTETFEELAGIYEGLSSSERELWE